MQTNHSSCRTSDHYFSLSLQQLSWGLLGTKDVSSQAFANFFESKQITAAGKMWQKSHCVYPHKIIQTRSLGIQWNTVTVCMQYPYCNGELEKNPTGNIIILQNYSQTNCQIITPMLVKSIGTTLGQYVF